MQIHKIQNYNNNQQTAFTSHVRMHHHDVVCVNRSFQKDKILKGIEQLQENGNNDRVFVETYVGDIYPRILINVVKKEGENLFAGTASGTACDSPAEIYEEALNNMKPAEDNPLYFGLNKVHMFFDDMKKAGQSQKYVTQLLDLEQTVKEGDSVSVQPFHNLWTNIWIDVIRKTGETYNHGFECVDVFHRDFYNDPYTNGYKRAIEREMEPREEYNSNPLYFNL